MFMANPIKKLLNRFLKMYGVSITHHTLEQTILIIYFMKIKTILYLLILTIIVNCCSYSNQSSEGLPIIDITKDYPEKEILITDIAKITYVHLSTKKNEYLYQGTINYISENNIIVVDESSGSVLFFAKDGTPKSRFNRYGNGPQEYAGSGWAMTKSINQILYDEKTDEVFISPNFKSVLQVYSSTGKYKRSINYQLDVRNCKIDFFNHKSFIFNSGNSFFLISKIDGEVLEHVEIPNSEVDLTIKGVFFDEVTIIFRPIGSRMVKSSNGFNLCNPGTDTVYYFDKNKVLTPVLCTTPVARDLNPVIILDNFWDVDKYQFMRIHTRHVSYYRKDNPDYLSDNPLYPDRYYVRDKKSGEVFRQKIILPDYKGKELYISAYPLKVFQKNLTHIELDLMELKEAYRANRLSGKLKELVSTLNEDEDNNVFMFIEFK